MIDPGKYVIDPGSTEISNIDLDAEEVYLPDGRRLTEELARELAGQTLEEIRRRNLIPGRKSLTGGAVHSPRVQFRVPADLQAKAEERAKREGKTVSKLAREALERYLAS